MTLDEFRALRPLHAFFPLVFDNGARWTDFSGHCGRCQDVFPPDDLRGTVVRPFPKIFVLDGWGYCPKCSLLTPIHYRLHENMAMTGRHPRTGEWSRWEPKREGRLRRWLRRLFDSG